MYGINLLKTVPVHTLEAGQKFVKVIGGKPCITILSFVITYDGVSEAETLRGETKTMSKFTLVLPIR